MIIHSSSPTALASPIITMAETAQAEAAPTEPQARHVKYCGVRPSYCWITDSPSVCTLPPDVPFPKLKPPQLRTPAKNNRLIHQPSIANLAVQRKSARSGSKKDKPPSRRLTSFTPTSPYYPPRPHHISNNSFPIHPLSQRPKAR